MWASFLAVCLFVCFWGGGAQFDPLHVLPLSSFQTLSGCLVRTLGPQYEGRVGLRPCGMAELEGRA